MTEFNIQYSRRDGTMENWTIEGINQEDADWFTKVGAKCYMKALDDKEAILSCIFPSGTSITVVANVDKDTCFDAWAKLRRLCEAAFGAEA